MRTLFVFLLLLPLTALAQRTDNFGKFVNSDGAIIKGTSMTKGFEKQIEVNNLVASSAGNNTTIRFSMPTGTASAAFHNLINTKLRLRSGEIIVTSMKIDRRITDYKISMENISVEECTDSDGNTLVQLKATRIGWTYYSTVNKSGATTVSSKSGWDAETQRPWVNF